MTNIFEYLNTQIYLSLIFIQTFVDVKFVCTNIFGRLFVSVLECKNYSNIYMYLNIYTIFHANIYSDVRSCKIFDTNIFGYSFM